MKRFLLLFFLLLLIPFLSSASIEMDDEFDSGETLIANIKASFVNPLTDENVVFYRGHVKIPMIYDIEKLGDEYYVYAQLLDKSENNYSLAIEDSTYFVGTGTSTAVIVKEFKITNSTAYFSVDPGIKYTDRDFSLDIKNLQGSEITVDSSQGENLVLSAGEENSINFDMESITENTGLFFIDLSSGNTSYLVPIYVFIEGTESKDSSNDTIVEEDEENKTLVDIIEEYLPTPNYTKKNNETNTSTSNQDNEQLVEDCNDRGGIVCAEDQKCNVSLTYLKEGPCCIGGFCEDEGGNSSGKLVGWILVILAIIVLIYLYKRVKKTKSKKISFSKK